MSLSPSRPDRRLATAASTAAAAAVACILLVACGGGDGETSAPDADGPLTVTMADYRFEGIPPEVDVGTAVTIRNTSSTELHELVAVRLPDTERRSVAELVRLPQAELMGLLGGGGEPEMVLLARPASDEVITAVGEARFTQAGRYLLICAIPTGADPGAYLQAAATSEGPPQVAGGAPHFASGMFAELRVG